jgi:hypothetical protein
MANPISGIDEAGRKIAGLLTYNPGPGIYSRLERAIEQMPENVRVQELPGLLKRYKEGVPGWELKETDLDSVIAGRDAVSRSELLARVKDRSPVYTHKEVVLADELPTVTLIDTDVLRRSKGGITQSEIITLPQYQEQASALGSGIGHGDPKYQAFGQGGTGYTELLLTQPGARASEYGNHWRDSATQYVDAAEDAVAHARYDTHGDALRINELQSDLGIHNRKLREGQASSDPPPQLPSETDSQYRNRMRDAGWRIRYLDDGNWEVLPGGNQEGLPFPLEDTWADLLIKRLALEAARKGHRAIEVASPRAIADKVGGNIDNYEHFYGKVVPGALERLGRKMGGLVDDGGVADDSTVNSLASIRSAISNADDEAAKLVWRVRRKAPGMGEELMKDEYDELVRKMVMMRKAGHDEGIFDKQLMGDYESAYRAGVRSLTGGNLMLPRAKREAGLAVNEMIARAKAQSALEAAQPAMNTARPAAKRYIMSDEMRRRLIEQGVGASVLAPLLMQEER